MRRAARCLLIALAIATAVGTPDAAAAEEGLTPRLWAVTGVAASDVLHLRDVPAAESKSLAGIPPGARGLKNLGCRRNQPPLEQWARMSQAQRHLAQTKWCRVEYRGQQGWVAARYLKSDDQAR